MTTRVLGPGDLSTYRTIRLDALRSDPLAFCSTFERESTFDDATWLARMTGYDGRPGAVLVDDAAVPAGMVGVGETESGERASLTGMWVRPEARGSGLGGTLVEAAVDWADGRGLAAVELWVVASNAVAVALYERCGFAATGAVDTVPGRPWQAEVEMRRRLRWSSGG